MERPYSKRMSSDANGHRRRDSRLGEAAAAMTRRAALLVILAALAVAPVRAQQDPAAGAPADPAGPRELVVLVHGLGRTSLSMWPLARALEREGFEVLNWGYSSLCCTVAELGERLRADLDRHRGDSPATVHFVGHSLGNVIIRWVLTREERPRNVGRVVMLAPPNQGSRDADRFAPLLDWLLEPISELRTDSTSTVRTLPRVEGVPIGIIAGLHDGKVSVAETHLPEEAAHVVVPSAHSFILFRSDVQRLVIGFLRHGRFPAGIGTPLHMP